MQREGKVRYEGTGARAAEIEKKVFVIAHRAATRRGWAIGSLILPSDWLYLAGHGPPRPPRRTEEANCSSSSERRASSLPLSLNSPRLVRPFHQQKRLESQQLRTRSNLIRPPQAPKVSITNIASLFLASLLLLLNTVRLAGRVLIVSGSNVPATNTTDISSRLLSM